MVLFADSPETPPWEPWRRWVPFLGIIAFAAAAMAIVLAVKPFVASGKNDRIVVTLPTLSPLRTSTFAGATTPGAVPAPSTDPTATAAAAVGAPTSAGETPETAAATSTAGTPDSAATTANTDGSAPTSAATTAAPPSTQSPIPAAPLQITSATATCTAPPSTDSHGNPTTFDASNTIDGRDSTTWRCPGDASGQSLTFTFAAPMQITSVGAEPGYNRIDTFNGDDRWLQNRRVTSITWTCIAANGSSTGTFSQTFQDVKQVQTTATKGGFDACASIQATITGATPAGTRDFTAISEVSAAGRPAK